MSAFNLSLVTPHAVAKMFHALTPGRNIRAYLPHVLAGLQEFGLTDRVMVLMALATIRAESERFAPISEGKSIHNTDLPNGRPFAKYDKRADLGNRGRGDGAAFKGRGLIQITGRANYTTIGQQLGIDLVGNPELANDPAIAGRILAAFLKKEETRIRKVLGAEPGQVSDEALKAARRVVNGGSHGLDRFTLAYRIGEGIFPA